MMLLVLLAPGGAQPEVFGLVPVASVVTPADLPSGGGWSSWRLDGSWGWAPTDYSAHLLRQLFGEPGPITPEGEGWAFALVDWPMFGVALTPGRDGRARAWPWAWGLERAGDFFQASRQASYTTAAWLNALGALEVELRPEEPAHTGSHPMALEEARYRGAVLGMRAMWAMVGGPPQGGRARPKRWASAAEMPAVLRLTAADAASDEALDDLLDEYRGRLGLAAVEAWPVEALERARYVLSFMLHLPAEVDGQPGTCAALVDRLVAELGRRGARGAVRVRHPERWDAEARAAARRLLAEGGERVFYVDGERAAMDAGAFAARFRWALGD
ncbi:MAG: hypothetical protein R3F65_09705 [bacterium]